MPNVTTPQATERQMLFRGVYRETKLPSCMVSLDDIRRLYAELDAKTREAIDEHLAVLSQPPNLTQEEFENLKSEARERSGLTTFIWGRAGKNVMITSPEGWDPMRLPREIQSITFDSNSSFRNFANIDLTNRFRMVIDFTGPPDFATYNPWNEPTPNKSLLEVQGQNETWVGGVQDHVMQFLRKDRRYRGWLHSHLSYNLLHWFIGFPLSLWLAFRLGSAFENQLSALPDVIRVGAYVYLVLVLANVFYFGIGILRWLFPLVELTGTRTAAARGIVGAIMLAIAGTVLYDMIKHIAAL